MSGGREHSAVRKRELSSHIARRAGEGKRGRRSLERHSVRSKQPDCAQVQACAPLYDDVTAEPQQHNSITITTGDVVQNVEKALAAVPGVTGAEVDLEEKTALIRMETEVADRILMDAVSAKGFQPIGMI